MTPAGATQPDYEVYRQSLRQALVNAWDELSLLYRLGGKVSRLTDEDEIAAVAVQEAVDILHADCGWAVLWEEERHHVPKGCRLAVDTTVVDEVNRLVLIPLRSRGKRQLLLHSVEAEYGACGPDAPVRLLVSAIATGGTECGFLGGGRGRAREAFNSTHQKLINAVSAVIAMELETVRLHRSEVEKQRLLHELEMARQVQRWLMPRDVCSGEFLEVAGLNEACYEIGGDCYDLYPLSAEQCLLLIADVTGKGAPASLQASLIQGIVHGSSRHSTDLPDLMGTLNRWFLSRAVRGNYPTALLAILNHSGLLTYTNGGHMRPLWIRKGGELEELEEGGPLLGFFPQAVYPTASAQMEAGDLLLLYTDGITDAENSGGETFGIERLHDWARRQAGCSPAEVKDSLLSTIKQFCQGCSQPDDLTALIVRYGQLERPRE
jgi:serine phosphatase RsbU (regulator of sigma subunit)